MHKLHALLVAAPCLASASPAYVTVSVPQLTSAICGDLGNVAYWAATAHIEKTDERRLAEAIEDAGKPNKRRPAIHATLVEAASLSGVMSHGNAGAGNNSLSAARADGIATAIAVYEMCLDGRLGNTGAPNWAQLTRSVEATVFYDKETLRRSSAGTMLWTLTNFNSVEVLGGKSYQSIKTQFEYDCPEERYRVRATISYEGLNGTGKFTGSTSLVEPWNPVAPKTMAQRLMKVACVR